MKKSSLMFVKTMLTYAHRELLDPVGKDNIDYIVNCIDDLLLDKTDAIELIADELRNVFEFNKNNYKIEIANETMAKLVLENKYGSV